MFEMVLLQQWLKSITTKYIEPLEITRLNIFTFSYNGNNYSKSDLENQSKLYGKWRSSLIENRFNLATPNAFCWSFIPLIAISR